MAAPRPIEATIEWAGLFVTEGDDGDAGVPIDERRTSFKEWTKVLTTTQVVAAVGERFAFEMRFSGGLPDTPVFYKVLTHVQPRAQGDSDDGARSQTRVSRTKICMTGRACVYGLRFDTPEEAIPGTWVFEIQVDGKTVATQRFEVARNPDVEQLPRGLWRGGVVWQMTQAKGARGETVEGQLTYSNCTGNPRIWFAEKGKEEGRFPTAFQVRSLAGTHILSGFDMYLGDDPGWVESVAWTLVEIQPELLVARLSRSVNNRGMANDDPLKSMGSNAYAELRKISDACLHYDR